MAREVNDPRLRAATVSRVEVTRDLTQARVFITPGVESEVGSVLRAFAKAAGFLRHGLALRLRARSVPRLLFSHDKALDEAAQLTRLIDAAVANTERERSHISSGRGD
jgi:ribosome-binding factor A